MQNGFSDDLNELEISSVNVEPLNNREKLVNIFVCFTNF